MPEASGLAPVIQGGYFRQVPGGDWVWGAKLTYAYLDASSSLRDVRMPQEGEFTSVSTGEVTPFTGNAIAQSYETSVTHQFSLLPYVGKTFDRGFFYLGVGPTISRVETDIGGLVGFADINGVRQDISGTPQDFSDSEWVWGAAATVGVTYFLSEALFLDVSYVYGRTRSYEGDYSSTFVNPNDQGRTTEGTLVGDSTGRLDTQLLSLSLNLAF
jgi:opacity protein-like surface antigen